MKRRLVKSVIWGVAITALSLLVSHEHCMDGPGRGLPFAAYSPVCGAWLFLRLDDSKIPQVLDFGALLADVLFWASAAAGAAYLINKKKKVIQVEKD